MKMLLAVDGSDYSRRALDFLERSGWLRPDNEISVCTVVLPVPHAAAAFGSVSPSSTSYRAPGWSTTPATV